VPNGQISALAEGSRSAQFDDRTKAVLLLAEEIHAVAVTDATFSLLQDHFRPGEIVELVVCAAHYESAARVLQALQVDVEPGYRPS
jgi:alkylhydroperoxidase family enzyme